MDKFIFESYDEQYDKQRRSRLENLTTELEVLTGAIIFRERVVGREINKLKYDAEEVIARHVPQEDQTVVEDV